jgi:lipopolysaccharide biosynthesis glycosyltransferase
MDGPGIHVVCAADEQFALPLSVMMKSAAIHTTGRPLVFHVLTSGLRRATRRRLEWAIAPHGASCTLFQVPASMLREAVVSGHISAATYYRLLSDHALPRELTRAIYLDADVVVTGDLQELWTLDTGGRALLAVPEVGIGEHLRPYLARHAAGAERATTFFNAGVMLVDLVRWRGQRIGERALEMIRAREVPLTFWDQDVLNIVAADAWGPLPPRWNLIGAAAVPDAPPGIIHFNTPIKPWHRNSVHPARSLFFQYLDAVDWGWRRPVWLLTDPAVRRVRRGWHYAKRRLRARARQ